MAAVGIIMDGNRRWAAENNLTPLQGHQKGVDKLFQVSSWSAQLGIRHLIVYAFSTENWQRTVTEITYLMDLMRATFAFLRSDLQVSKTRLRFMGSRAELALDIQDMMVQLEHESAQYESDFTLWICLNYGGRREILEAAQKLQQSSEPITEATFRQAMWSADMPDPDLIIRTGEQKRLSGFLTWAAIYSELFFVDTLWPDFSFDELKNILLLYSTRKRKFGK